MNLEQATASSWKSEIAVAIAAILSAIFLWIGTQFPYLKSFVDMLQPSIVALVIAYLAKRGFVQVATIKAASIKDSTEKQTQQLQMQIDSIPTKDSVNATTTEN